MAPVKSAKQRGRPQQRPEACPTAGCERGIHHLRTGEAMTLSRRLALAMVLLVVVTSCAVSAVAYYFRDGDTSRARADDRSSAPRWPVARLRRARDQPSLRKPLFDAAAAGIAGRLAARTEQARAYQALVDSERMARSIIEDALDAFVQTDGSCVILDWSPHAEALMGWTHAEAVGRSVEELSLSGIAACLRTGNGSTGS